MIETGDKVLVLARRSLKFILDADAVKDRSEVRIGKEGKGRVGDDGVKGWEV